MVVLPRSIAPCWSAPAIAPWCAAPAYRSVLFCPDPRSQKRSRSQFPSDLFFSIPAALCRLYPLHAVDDRALSRGGRGEPTMGHVSPVETPLAPPSGEERCAPCTCPFPTLHRTPCCRRADRRDRHLFAVGDNNPSRAHGRQTSLVGAVLRHLNDRLCKEMRLSVRPVGQRRSRGGRGGNGTRGRRRRKGRQQRGRREATRGDIVHT